MRSQRLLQKNLKKAGLASRNIVLHVNISRCVSLAVVFDFSSFLFFKSPLRSMERHTCLMIFIFIIYGGFSLHAVVTSLYAVIYSLYLVPSPLYVVHGVL